MARCRRLRCCSFILFSFLAVFGICTLVGISEIHLAVSISYTAPRRLREHDWPAITPPSSPQPLSSSSTPRETAVAGLALSTSTGSTIAPGNSYKMVVGILSAKRDPSTVVGMARELVQPVAEGDYKLLAWISRSAADEDEVINSLGTLGFTVFVNDEDYPELAPENVRITHNDSLERVIWRTSHVLDYANLLEHALQYDSEYVLILEDDLKPAKSALDKSYKFATSLRKPMKTNWGYLTLFTSQDVLIPSNKVTKDGNSGACALMIRRSLIPRLIKYLRHDPYDSPVDLLLYQYLRSYNMEMYQRIPNLFQHISPHSSFTGKDRNLRNTESMRSRLFLYDEDNMTLVHTKSQSNAYGYMGCFRDDPVDRDISGIMVVLNVASPSYCREFCRSYSYYGLQNGRECRCGNEFGKYGKAPDSECNVPCQHPHGKRCGGTLRNSVYRCKPFNSLYVGCFSTSDKTFVPQDYSYGSATPTQCGIICHSYRYFALQGVLCFCGNSLDGYRQVEERHCSTRCRDDIGQACGGIHFQSVFSVVHPNI